MAVHWRTQWRLAVRLSRVLPFECFASVLVIGLCARLPVGQTASCTQWAFALTGASVGAFAVAVAVAQAMELLLTGRTFDGTYAEKVT